MRLAERIGERRNLGGLGDQGQQPIDSALRNIRERFLVGITRCYWKPRNDPHQLGELKGCRRSRASACPQRGQHALGQGGRTEFTQKRRLQCTRRVEGGFEGFLQPVQTFDKLADEIVLQVCRRPFVRSRLNALGEMLCTLFEQREQIVLADSAVEVRQ